jgi:DNA-binding response OmpR family regulator
LAIAGNPELATSLHECLSQLPAHVSVVLDGQAGLVHGLKRHWDAVVLDTRLPDMYGMDLCRRLRQGGATVPILMLTPNSGEIDRVLGLELGADDCLPTPLSERELVARIRALWRRAAMDAARRSDVCKAVSEPELRAGMLSMDQRKRRAWMGEEELSLTPREFSLLWVFAAQPGRAFSREELLSAAWGYRHDVYDHTVNTHINRLRNKLGSASWIRTVWGVGYRFEIPEG